MYFDNIFKFIILLAMLTSAVVLIIDFNLLLLTSVTIYLSILFFSFYVNFKKFKIFHQIFIFLNVFWIILRLIYLLFFPESFNYDYILTYENSQFSYTIFFIAISSIFFLFSLYVVSSNFTNTNDFSNRQPISTKSLNAVSIYFIFVLVLNLILNQSFSIFDNYYVKLIVVFFSIDVFVILFCFYFIYYKDQLSKKQLFFSYLIFTIFIIIRTITGSKAALYSLFLNFIIGYLLIYPKLYINKKYILSIFVLVPISVLIFILGSVFRFNKTFSGENLTNLISLDSLLDTYNRLDIISTFPNIMETLSKRISMLDYTHVLVNKTPQFDYLGIEYFTKSFFNVILPSRLSDFFGISDASILQANLFKASFGWGTFLESVDNYHSDMLPLFGWLHLNFGFVFSLISIFILFIIFLSMFNLKIENNFYKFLYRGFFVLIFIDLLFGMGIVASFQQVLFFYIFPLIFYKLFKLIYNSVPKIKFK